MYTCDICPESFSLKEKLKDHRKMHEIVSVSFECDKCDYKTKGDDELNQHIKSAHKGILYNCDQCDNIFNNEYIILRSTNTEVYE